MEPDISDQFNSVGEYVSRRLIQVAQGEDAEAAAAAQKRQVNVRLPQGVYDQLAQLAGDLGDSPSGLASDLLELAIVEAANVGTPE